MTEAAEKKGETERKPFDVIGAALPTIITSVLAAVGTIGVAYMTGIFDVRKVDTVNQGSVTLEKLRFSNDLVKNALASTNPGNSLLFYADIGLLEGLNISKVREYAGKENDRLKKGGGGTSILPSFDKASRPNLWLDRNIILALTPNAKPEIVDALVSTGNYLMLGFGINTNVKRLSMFLGQVAHETAGFSILEETRSESSLNQMYANRMGNGPASSGDGWKCRGRGLIQVTGKANYERFSKETGVDVVTNPDIMRNPHVAILIAASYWYNGGLNELADQDNLQGVTRKINGGLGGFDNRKKLTDDAFKILNEKMLKSP